MAIIKWTPFFEEPFHDMDKFFENLSPAIRGGVNKAGFMPAINMYEDEKNVIVETEMAGVDPDKVDISVENDVLIVKGESEKKSEVEDKNYYRKEIRSGSFYRSIQLPTHVNGDKASAIAMDGILKITIPKMTSVAKKSKIKVVKGKK